MPRSEQTEGESKKDPTEPVRIDRQLMRLIRLLAPVEGMSAPKWIHAKLREAADHAQKRAPSQFKKLLDDAQREAADD